MKDDSDSLRLGIVTLLLGTTFAVLHFFELNPPTVLGLEFFINIFFKVFKTAGLIIFILFLVFLGLSKCFRYSKWRWMETA